MRPTIVVVALLALVPGWRDSPSPPEPVRVTVSRGGVATAVAAGPGRVLTVAHVLDGARDVRVGGRSARVVRIDARRDLAVLATAQASRSTKVAYGDSSVPVDVVVHVLRDGRAVALGARVERRVSASIDGHVRPALELAARVEPGDSGAPVTDARGRVIGIVFAQGERSAWAVDLSSG